MGKRTNTAKWLVNQKRWQVNVQKDGQRRSFTSSTPGRTGQREANAKADAWLDDNIVSGRRKIRQLYDLYIKSLDHASIDYKNSVSSKGKTWIVPHIGNKTLDNLTEQDLQNILNAAYKKGLSKKSIQNIKATVMSFLKFCRKSKWTKFYPEDLQIPSGARTREKQILQPKHLITLFSCDTTELRGQRVQDDFINAYRLQVLRGFRPGEVLGLKKEDRQGQIIKLSRSINVHGETTRGKNNNAVRPVPISGLADRIWTQQAALSDIDFLFPSRSESTYRHRWKRYCESNGIPYVPPYNLRHTFVSVVKNLSEGQVKELVGHSTNMDTFDVYGHRINGELIRTSNDIEKLFQAVMERQRMRLVKLNGRFVKKKK